MRTGRFLEAGFPRRVRFLLLAKKLDRARERRYKKQVIPRGAPGGETSEPKDPSENRENNVLETLAMSYFSSARTAAPSRNICISGIRTLVVAFRADRCKSEKGFLPRDVRVKRQESRLSVRPYPFPDFFHSTASRPCVPRRICLVHNVPPKFAPKFIRDPVARGHCVPAFMRRRSSRILRSRMHKGT